MSKKKPDKKTPDDTPKDSIVIESVEQLEALLTAKRAELEAMRDLGASKKSTDEKKPN